MVEGRHLFSRRLFLKTLNFVCDDAGIHDFIESPSQDLMQQVSRNPKTMKTYIVEEFYLDE